MPPCTLCRSLPVPLSQWEGSFWPPVIKTSPAWQTLLRFASPNGGSGSEFPIMPALNANFPHHLCEHSQWPNIGFPAFPQRSMRPPLHIHFEARADASAKGQQTVLGGYVSHPAFGQLWFSESFSVQDFRELGIPVSSDMASKISCYEALAQGGLIIAASSLLPSCSVPILLPSASDNTGAEAALNACFTTSLPLALFLERLTLLAAVHRCSLDVSHIPREKNTKADALSRPEEYTLPADCLLQQRLRLDLHSLWLPRPHIAVFPPGAPLRWGLPATITNDGQVSSLG